MGWDGMGWDGKGWDGMRWDGMEGHRADKRAVGFGGEHRFMAVAWPLHGASHCDVGQRRPLHGRYMAIACHYVAVTSHHDVGQRRALVLKVLEQIRVSETAERGVTADRLRNVYARARGESDARRGEHLRL